ncbi:MAG TPA: hypothetical protein VLI90_13200 [Tepidisphaeraceae bacterium]|nr:hypothetical protein [Tepidisphaeraceae bacterium]
MSSEAAVARFRATADSWAEKYNKQTLSSAGISDEDKNRYNDAMSKETELLKSGLIGDGETAEAATRMAKEEAIAAENRRHFRAEDAINGKR